MSEHNVKISLFRNSIEPSQWVSNQSSAFLECQSFGCVFERYSPTKIKSGADSRQQHVIEIESRTLVIDSASEIAKNFAHEHKINQLHIGIKVGSIATNQTWIHVSFGYGDDRQRDFGDLIKQLKKNLPYSIKTACSNLMKPIYAGDIVAMNRSSLREIIAHD